MPKKDGKKWKVDFRPDGTNGKRYIRLFDSKADAQYFEKSLLSGRLEQKSDNRRLNDLITIWYDLHGQTLKSSDDTKNRLHKISNALSDPVASNLDVSKYSFYRSQRLQQNIQPSTLNRELATLKALFRELKRLSVIDYDSPIFKIRKLKESKTELTYFDHQQITQLSHQVKQSKNPSLYYVVMICLATGARWSEANNLKKEHLQKGGFMFFDTKNSSNRFVPVDTILFNTVQDHLNKYQLQPCYGAFRSAIKRTGITVPAGQLAHVLRHTFASHFIMNGGNIRTLQQLLGHSSLNVTMRYAHLSPDYLDQAKTLNPIASIDF
jgi:integrase